MAAEGSSNTIFSPTLKSSASVHRSGSGVQSHRHTETTRLARLVQHADAKHGSALNPTCFVYGRAHTDMETCENTVLFQMCFHVKPRECRHVSIRTSRPGPDTHRSLQPLHADSQRHIKHWVVSTYVTETCVRMSRDLPGSSAMSPGDEVRRWQWRSRGKENRCNGQEAVASCMKQHEGQHDNCSSDLLQSEVSVSLCGQFVSLCICFSSFCNFL